MSSHTILHKCNTDSCTPQTEGARVAALDLGSSNCRLLTATVRQGSIRSQRRYSRLVKLGSELDAEDRLSGRVRDFTTNAVRRCLQSIEGTGQIRLRAVATEACRRAVNSDDLIQQIEQEVGVKFEVIEPKEEARLIVLACNGLFDFRRPRSLVVDIGAGSTQIAWVRCVNRQIDMIDCISLPFGVLRQDIKGSPQDRMEGFHRLATKVMEALAPFCFRYSIRDSIDHDAVQVLVSAGTIGAIYRLMRGRQGTNTSADGAILPQTKTRQLNEQLVTMSRRSLSDPDALGRNGANFSLTGCAILDGLCRAWPSHVLQIADRRLGDGIVRDLAAQPLSLSGSVGQAWYA